MLVPVYGFVEGDSMGVVVLVQDTDSVLSLGQVLAQACEMRVAPFSPARVFLGSRQLEPSLTVAEAGIEALSRVDLRRDVPEGEAHGR